MVPNIELAPSDWLWEAMPSFTDFFNICFYIMKKNTWNILSVSQWEGNGNPLQYSCLESPMDGRAWWAAVHGVTKGRPWLSDFTFTFHFHALEKERAIHSSVLAWRIPGTVGPGGRPSMGSHRVGHDWSDLAAAAMRGWCIWQALSHSATASNTLNLVFPKISHW